MKELKVKNVIIGKQFKNSSNYQKLLEIAKQKKINIFIVEANQKISIEKNIYFNVLWPNSKDAITENSLNNNSLVCKLVYNNFSMLFTGDIEAIAEKAIIKKYDGTDLLNSTILKVAHHRVKIIINRRFFKRGKT